MKYNELILPKSKDRIRAGRGIAGGRGKTAGRGTKGQGSRKSGNVRPGFEGGQMPLYMRIPKLRGFKSHATPVEVVYTGQLEALKATKIDNQVLFDAGLLKSQHSVAKVLVNGELSAKKDVKLQSASAAAIKAIEKAGGSFEAAGQLARIAKKTDKEA